MSKIDSIAWAEIDSILEHTFADGFNVRHIARSSRYRAVATLAPAFALRRVNYLPNGEEPSRSKYSITLRSGMIYSNIYITNFKEGEVVIREQ